MFGCKKPGYKIVVLAFCRDGNASQVKLRKQCDIWFCLAHISFFFKHHNVIIRLETFHWFYGKRLKYEIW